MEFHLRSRAAHRSSEYDRLSAMLLARLHIFIRQSQPCNSWFDLAER